MSEPLDWDRDGRHWPHRDASRFVESDGIRWHVQTMGREPGTAPVLLLLHGTGASTHSLRGVMPALADRYTLVAPDLPGHAFTGRLPDAQMTLPGMATAILGLIATLDITPDAIIGHSAGAAIALTMARERDRLADTPIIGLNAALTPLPWPATQVFPAMARLLALNPLVPKVFSGVSRLAGDTAGFIQRSTSSRIDREGARCYATLLGNSRHARGALAMMANWDLDTLDHALPDIGNPVLLVHARGDNAIPLSGVEEAARKLPHAQLEVLPALGHLAHEERPEDIAELISAFLAAHGVEGAR